MTVVKFIQIYVSKWQNLFVDSSTVVELKIQYSQLFRSLFTCIEKSVQKGDVSAEKE